jgi:ribose transport system substrate-binding protein
VRNARVPVRVFDRSNIGQAGPRFTSGWGNAYVSGYRRLWGLS